MDAKRHITAILLLPLFVAFVMFLPPAFFTALICAASALALREFYLMYGVMRPLAYAGIILGALTPVAFHAGAVRDALFASLMAMAALRLFSRASPDSALSEAAPAFFGLLYIPGLLGYQVLLRNEAPELILFLYGAVWGGDAAAYYVGTAFGKRKLYESISPNKTVAGAAGALLGGMAGALLVRTLLMPNMPLYFAAVAGVVLGAAGIVGDLVESMFKRDAGVKDSSSLLPGHGGVLDKIDGLVFASPVLWWMLFGPDLLK